MKCIRRYFQVKSLNQGNSILGIILLFLLFAVGSLTAQNQTPQELKQQMAKIRQSTNWEDPVAAKKANDQIKILSKQLMMSGKPPADLPAGLSKSEAEEIQQESVDYKMKLWGQMQESAKQGEGADILLAKPIRDEIVEAYKDDESPKIRNKEYLEEQTFLCIDMSLNTVQRTIDQMELFKSIKVLLIFGGKNGAPLNLDDILTRAANYPLEKLYIINFQYFVTSIPDKVAVFNNLRTLALFNNRISKLPDVIGQLTSLRELYVDINPISTLFPMIQLLARLDTLGIAKTQVPTSEVDQIKTILPNCKIFSK